MTGHEQFIPQSDMALKRATSNRKSFLNKRVQTAHKHNKKADEIRKKASFYKVCLSLLLEVG